MEPHAAPATSEGPAAEPFPPPIRGIAVASISLGFFGLLVFWWFPFGLLLSICGLACGLTGLVLGIRGGRDGENLALVGTLISGAAFGLIVTLYRGIHVLLQDLFSYTF